MTVGILNCDNFQQNAMNPSVQLYVKEMHSVIEEICFGCAHTQAELNKII